MPCIIHSLRITHVCIGPEGRKALLRRKATWMRQGTPVLIDESPLPQTESQLSSPSYDASFQGFAVADSFCARYRSRRTRVLDRHPHPPFPGHARTCLAASLPPCVRPIDERFCVIGISRHRSRIRSMPTVSPFDVALPCRMRASLEASEAKPSKELIINSFT